MNVKAGYGGDGVWPHTDFILHLRAKLQPGQSIKVEERDVVEIMPHFWREEADTREGWFKSYCGAFDLNVFYDLVNQRFTVSKPAGR